MKVSFRLWNRRDRSDRLRYASPSVVSINSDLPSTASETSPATATLKVRFDAERDTPELINVLNSRLPGLREIMTGLRSGVVPLVPSSQVGAFGNFVRLPNHYRSVCLVVPGSDGASSSNGVIAFKGTEPLLPDFPQYFDWMLRAPFRTSNLPLGLHFALDTKLPPAAMWIEECVQEQKITSRIQHEYVERYRQLARLPVPLFVYELAAEQVERYRGVVREGLPAAAFSRIEAKVVDGLGVEVYYYPSLPVRAVDLLSVDVNKAFIAPLTGEALEATFKGWFGLTANLLALGYMPYAPWNHGMGAYVDPGNACIDGGFNDLLTIVPFDSIPNEHLFWLGLGQSIQMLASSVVVMCSVAARIHSPPLSEPPATAVAYVKEGLRKQIRSHKSNKHFLDSRLLRFFDSISLEDVFRHLRETQRERNAAQFRRPEPAIQTSIESEATAESRLYVPRVLGV